MAFLKDDDGKFSIWRIVISTVITATIATLVGFSVNIAYQRYSWMRDQCYKVAINEKNIIQEGENLKAKDAWLENEINKNNDILHRRVTSVGDNLNYKIASETVKRENSDERMMDLIIKIFEHQQKQVEIQQKSLETK